MTLETIIECLEKEHFCDSCPNQDSECTGYGCVYVNTVKLINTQQSEIDRLQQENKQLKELLRLAVGDMHHCDCCEVCKNHDNQPSNQIVCGGDCEICELDCECKRCMDEDLFTWQHSDKLKGLIEI